MKIVNLNKNKQMKNGVGSDFKQQKQQQITYLTTVAAYCIEAHSQQTPNDFDGIFFEMEAF